MLARPNGVRWYGHVLRRSEEDILMKEMVHEVYKNVNRATEDVMEKTS